MKVGCILRVAQKFANCQCGCFNVLSGRNITNFFAARKFIFVRYFKCYAMASISYFRTWSALLRLLLLLLVVPPGSAILVGRRPRDVAVRDVWLLVLGGVLWPLARAALAAATTHI